MPTPDHAALVDRTIAGYRILRLLGAGGMGAVYEALAPTRDRVALKVLSPALSNDAKLRHRFVREAAAQQQLQHPNVVPVLGSGEDNQLGLAFIVMEFTPNGSLGARLKGRGPMSEDDARGVFADVLTGLGHAHTAGYVHRDIKPDNVLFRPDGRAALADFGIVGVLGGSDSAQLTQTGSILGTPAYMSPEACDGKTVDQRSDLYSVGCMLYQAVTGRMVFAAGSLSAMLVAQVRQAPEPPSAHADISEDLDAIILRLLEKRPKDRFPTAEEVLRVLRAGYLTDTLQGTTFRKRYEAALTVVDGRPPSTVEQTPPSRLGASRRRSGSAAGTPSAPALPPRPSALTWTLGVVAVALAGLSAWAVMQWQSESAGWADARAGLAEARSQLEAERAAVAHARATADSQAATLRQEIDRLESLEPIAAAHRRLLADLTQRTLSAWDHSSGMSGTKDLLGSGKVDEFLALAQVQVRYQPSLESDVDFLVSRGILRAASLASDPEAALADVDKALAIRPDNAHAHLARFDLLLLLQRHGPEADAELEDVLRLDDSLGAAWFRHALHAQGGNLDAKIADLNRANQLAPDNGMVLVMRGLTHHEMFRKLGGTRQALVEQARRDVDEAIRVEPLNSQVWMFRGVYFQFCGQLQEAIACHERALDLSPDNNTAWYHHAISNSNLQRYDVAIHSMQQSARFGPSGSAWRNVAVMRMNAGQFREAVDDLRRAIELDPEMWDAHAYLGRALAASDQPDAARAAYDDALKFCPESERARLKDQRARLDR